MAESDEIDICERDRYDYSPPALLKFQLKNSKIGHSKRAYVSYAVLAIL